MPFPRFSLTNPTKFDYVPSSELNVLIDEFVHSERDRAMMKRYLIDGISLEALAEEFGMSVKQTQTIVKARKDFLMGFLNNKGKD